MAYARDFCFLQHGCPATDPKTGERLYIVAARSVERPEVPDMEKLCRRIRSTVMTSGDACPGCLWPSAMNLWCGSSFTLRLAVDLHAPFPLGWKGEASVPVRNLSLSSPMIDGDPCGLLPLSWREQAVGASRVMHDRASNDTGLILPHSAIDARELALMIIVNLSWVHYLAFLIRDNPTQASKGLSVMIFFVVVDVCQRDHLFFEDYLNSAPEAGRGEVR